jgi:hypothetical protein
MNPTGSDSGFISIKKDIPHSTGNHFPRCSDNSGSCFGRHISGGNYQDAWKSTSAGTGYTLRSVNGIDSRAKYDEGFAFDICFLHA